MILGEMCIISLIYSYVAVCKLCAVRRVKYLLVFVIF